MPAKHGPGRKDHVIGNVKGTFMLSTEADKDLYFNCKDPRFYIYILSKLPISNIAK